jgi:DNA-binding response OmpR family regulator
MTNRADRLSKMVGEPPPQDIPKAKQPEPSKTAAAPRRRALLFAPAPAQSGAYLTLLEEEGFDVLVAQDATATEALIRSAPPDLILAIVPVLGPELLQSWKTLAPRAEVRQMPGLIPLLEERLVPAKELFDFTVRILSALSGMLPAAPGASRDRTSQILGLAEKAAERLELSERDRMSVRIAAVISGLADSFHADTSSSQGDEQHSVTELLPTRRRALTDFAEAMGCPFPIATEPPSQTGAPKSSREPTPLEVVDAAASLVLLREGKADKPLLELRKLGVESETETGELHPAAVEAVIAALAGDSKRSRGEILLVDPEPATRNVLALRLRNEGYSVLTAADGRLALEDIRRSTPALVMSETVLPGLDGFGLLDALKREGKGNIPYVFLSSRSDPLSVNKGLLLGAADFLGKPVNFEVLLTKLEKALSQQVELSDVSARLSLSDVSLTAASGLPSVNYDELKPGVDILGRFQIEADLGEGGMGKVFKARDIKLEEQVVLKVMKPGFADDVLKRFKREIRLARKITHPGVVRIYDFWEAGPLTFVTMEFLEGSDLRNEIKNRGAFPPPVALRIATEIFEALSAAHDVGVVHRDMKPHNVLMLPTGRIKVLDFGIAQGLEPNVADAVTAAGAILGTPEYMSPEQLMGDSIDPRTDIYSTGVLLYELLTGQLPFQDQNRVATAQKRLTTDPDAPSSKLASIPPAVDALVLHLLKRNRDERHPTAKAVIVDLAQIRSSLR